MRLAWHIHRRNRDKDEDRRYQELLQRAPHNQNMYALRSVYLTQGAVMWLVSLPVQFAQYGDGPWVTVLFGVAVVARRVLLRDDR